MVIRFTPLHIKVAFIYQATAWEEPSMLSGTRGSLDTAFAAEFSLFNSNHRGASINKTSAKVNKSAIGKAHHTPSSPMKPGIISIAGSRNSMDLVTVDKKD